MVTVLRTDYKFMVYDHYLAPSGDKTLTEDDAMDIFEEILPAQNESYKFGLKLKLPAHEVDSIHKTISRPSDQLLAVIMRFLKETDPSPSWRVIVNALRSPAVNQLQLASKVEAAHFPDLTSTRDVPQDTTVATGALDIR